MVGRGKIPYRGHRSVTLTKEFVDKVEENIEQEYGSRPTRPAIGGYMEDLATPVIEEKELLRRYGALLQEMPGDGDNILIKDNRNGDFAELAFRNYCSLDNSDNCVHIGFAWAIPKVMKARVEKKPRVER